MAPTKFNPNSTIMSKKITTNDQMLKALIKGLTPLEIALLRERIVLIGQITKRSIEEEPEKWANGFVHPDLYLTLVSKIEAHLGFEK
jgi:hypothetical protein